MKFLFIIFLLFVLFVFLFGFSILRLLFGGLFRKPVYRSTGKSSRSQQASDTSSKPSSSKKIIAPDEGEYVDYVEIKE
jgi:hypothetical protein